MKRMQTVILVALMLLGARAASADTLTSTNDGMTVTDTVMTAAYAPQSREATVIQTS